MPYREGRVWIIIACMFREREREREREKKGGRGRKTGASSCVP